MWHPSPIYAPVRPVSGGLPVRRLTDGCAGLPVSVESSTFRTLSTFLDLMPGYHMATVRNGVWSVTFHASTLEDDSRHGAEVAR
jgi:hypothetical protein